MSTSSLSSVLNAASRALMAHQRALEVTAQNVANANVPGYTRQRPEFVRDAVDGTVDVPQVTRLADPLVARHLLGAVGEGSYWDTQRTLLEHVEALYGEPSAGGLAELMDAFWGAWQDLGNDPTNDATRVAVLHRASALADALGGLAKDLRHLQRLVDERVRFTVQQVNDVAARIARLNADIAGVGEGTTQGNALRDQRDQALRELAGLLQVSVVEEGGPSHTVTVLGGGRVLVAGARANPLTTVGTGGPYKVPAWEADGTPLAVEGGTLAALLEVRDQVVPAHLAALDDLASTLITEVNNVHRTGYGLSGATGLDFFLGTGAGDIQTNATLLGDPASVATAAQPASPGDGSVALAIYGLRDTATMQGGTVSMDGFYRAHVATLGAEVQQARTSAQHREVLVRHLDQLRQAVSGVSLDEELTNLVRYQNAYAVSARLVQVVSEAMEYLIHAL